MRCSRSSSKNPASLVSKPGEPAVAHQRQAGAPTSEGGRHVVVVDVDEVRHADRVDLAQPFTELVEGTRLAGVGEVPDLLGHRLPVVTHAQLGAVGERRPVHRVEWVERDVARHVGPGGGERVSQQVGHREHRRAAIDAKPLLDEHTCPPARHRFALEHGDLVTTPHEMGGSRQTAEPGADHDDAHVRSPAG